MSTRSGEVQTELLKLFRVRWMELALLALGFPMLAWGLLGNPSRADLVRLQGRVDSVERIRHAAGGESLEFRVAHSKRISVRTYDRAALRGLQPDSEIDVLVWPGGDASDLATYAGEAVEIRSNGEHLLSYAYWWRGHLLDVLWRLTVGLAFCGTSFWYLLRRHPMRLDAGANVAEADRTLVPRPVVLAVGLTLLLALIALSVHVYL